MANSSHSNPQPDQDQQVERLIEDQQQQRCICQGHFGHDQHQKYPALFSHVAQQIMYMAFNFVAVWYALAFGLYGVWSTVAGIRALHIAEHNNALSTTANQLALLQACLSNSTFDEHLCAWVVSHTNITLPRPGPQRYPGRVFANVEFAREDLRILNKPQTYFSLVYLIFPIGVYFVSWYYWKYLKSKML